MKAPAIIWVLTGVGLAARGVQAATAFGLGTLGGPWVWTLGPFAVLGAASLDALALGVPLWVLARLRGGTIAGHLAAGWLGLLAAIYLAVQPAFYSLFQGPLTADQLALAGDVRDLSGSILVAAPWWTWTLAACAAAGARWAHGRTRELTRAALMAVSVGWIAWGATPDTELAGLQRSAVAALVPSPTPATVNLPAKPKLARTPLTPQPQVEPLEALVRPAGLPRPRTNVVLWALESMSVAKMGYGGPGLRATMPQTAELADRGVSFDRYYAITPVSMKSLVSMTCSIHPYTRPQALTYINPEIACADLATQLKGAGYRTALVHAGHFHYSDKDRFFRPRGYELLLDADPIRRRHGGARNAWGVDDASMVDAAIAWLDGLSADERFFLMVIPVSPHHPYGGDYRAALGRVDRQIGRLRRAIEARWAPADTLHVLAGDHGEAFGEHRGHTMHGSYIYDEAMRVPLVLSNPEMFVQGARSTRLGNHVDLAPTLLDALGMPPIERHEGASLLRGHTPHLVHMFTQYAHHQLGLIDGRFKYILDLDLGTQQVFDVLDDPGETRNIAAGQADYIPGWKKEVLRFEAFYQALIPHYDFHWFPERACARASACALGDLPVTFESGVRRTDRSARGKPLTAGGDRWERGIGVAAPSVLRWSLKGLPFRRLVGAVAHDDGIYPGQLAAVVSAEVYVDGQLRFHSGQLTVGDAPRELSVDVRGAEILELFAHDMDGLHYRNLVDWLDVRLER